MPEKNYITSFFHCFICLFVSAPNVAPSDVGGGGGSNRELTITWVVSINKLYISEAALPTLNLKLILFPKINRNKRHGPG